MAEQKKKQKKAEHRAHSYIVLDCARSVYGEILEGKPYDEDTADTVRDTLADLIEQNRVTHDIWLWGLSLCCDGIISMLHIMGYEDMTGSGISAKAWHTMSFDYTIATTGVCYRIRVRSHGKRTLSIYDASNVLGKDLDSIAHSFAPVHEYPIGLEPSKLEIWTESVKCGIKQTCGGYKKTPYTVSMVAQRVFHKLSGIQWNDFMMVDCYNILLPGSTGKDENDNPTYRNLDEFLRPSYKSGYNFLSDLGAEYTENGITLDINSLYPWVMATKPVPWGEPTYFEGAPPKEAFEVTRGSQRYYYVRLRCAFELKEGYLPYIGIADWSHGWGQPLRTSDLTDMYGITHKYVKVGNKKKRVTVELTLSKTDWELMQEAYNIEELEYIEGVYFDCSRFVFKDFVNIMYEEKRKARADGDRAMERYTKLILNATAGTLAKIRDRESVVFTFDENGEMYGDIKKTRGKSKSYIHMASAILSYARERIYRDACKYSDRFLYSDTDSLHLAGDKIPDDIVISDKLGDYKVEDRFSACTYYKRKVYAHFDGEYHITYAGLSREYRDYIEDLLNEYCTGRKQCKLVRGEKSRAFFKHFPRSMYGDNFNEFELSVGDMSTLPPNKILEELKYFELPSGEKLCTEMECLESVRWLQIIK